MASEVDVIVELPRDGAADRNLRASPPPSVASGRVILDHVTPEAPGRLGLPEAGQVVMSVLSPEALRRDRQEVEDVIRAAETDEPLVIIVEAAEELREDELGVVADAAARAHRQVILRVMADA